jgi:hypothetical protein
MFECTLSAGLFMEFANTGVAHAVEINRIEISVLLAVIRYSSELAFLWEIPGGLFTQKQRDLPAFSVRLVKLQ